MRIPTMLNRREFLKVGVAVSSLLVACRESPSHTDGEDDELDAFMKERMKTLHIPGLAACIVKDKEIVWSKSYGWANIEQQIPMSLDTLQNIASISKTFTATALMQLWEKGELGLDDDINAYLPFEVRNPAHPSKKITFKHLLTHTSSIDDGSSYSRAYACGDPTISLQIWLREYFAEGGAYYNREENFHDWMPGEQYAYNNVAFGLLGYLVEAISGTPFAEYCRANIFLPLGLEETSWFLADIDPSKHAVPYTYVSDGHARGPSWGGLELGSIQEGGPSGGRIEKDGYTPNCLYNHPNFPDGFLRTSVNQLTRYMLAYLNGGSYQGKRVLEESSIRNMLTVHFGESGGLCWFARRLGDGELFWGHGGSDPGVNTRIDFRSADGLGAIVFTNTNGAEPQKLNERLIQEALHRG
ncbi:MAG: serine hydrolase domain-containing protein [Acidobacteriota bacterium]